MNKPQKLKATCTVNADECIKLKELFNSKSLLAMEKLDIKQATNGFGMTLNGFDATMHLIEIIPLEKPEIEKADDMNLENTKVYTTDPEVIRKLIDLTGLKVRGGELLQSENFGCLIIRDYGICTAIKGSSSEVDKRNLYRTITPDQINALYDEKFGKVEWKNGDTCDYKNEDDEWESDGRYVCFDSFAEHHVFCANNMEMYHAASDQIRKPETPQQREERERDELAKQLMLDACGDDIFADRDWEYHKKYTHTANQCFKLVDAGYRKQKDGE